ncbi:MAG: hypothetical protein LBH12_07105, partial [Dysgonamonadaceae bacterium]|nr:hypothetical protein [Dysgonamonadaceae bacterium]
KYRLLPVIFCLLLSSYSRAQVTIGANIDPNEGSLLDLKEYPSNQSANSTKGLGMPRVNLSDWNELAPILSNPDAKDKRDHIGLVVYNMPGKSWMLPGIYVWDGAKWAGINVENTVEPPYATCDPLYYKPDATKYVDIDVDEDGAGPLLGKTTLRFLTYNLGANPNMTVKEQMAYVSTMTNLEKDITVFGGLFQWGRKDWEHSLRCSKDDMSDSFTQTLYSSTSGDNNYYDPAISHKFAWGGLGSAVMNNDIDWISPHVDNLWGNGLDVNAAPIGGNGEIVDGKVIPPGKTVYDPCPDGFRVPTEYEWALLAQKEGVPGEPWYDYLYTSGGADGTTASSGLVWVPVSKGKASTDWDDSKTNGYALYLPSEWDVSNPYEDDLTLPEAPEPLLFLPAAGYRHNNDGNVSIKSSSGSYWTSVVDVYGGRVYSYSMLLGRGEFIVDEWARAGGFSVRCIAAE